MQHLKVIIGLLSLVYFSQSLTAQIELEKGSIYFSIDLYKKLSSSEKDNIFCAPLSISSALSIPYLGSRNLTKKQMEKALYYSPDQARNLSSYKTLIDQLKDANTEKTSIEFSNSMWIDKEHPFKSNFLQACNRNCKEDLHKVDFSKNANENRKMINNLVAEKTNNKIQDLIPVNAINLYTKFVITNAVYFSGTWKHSFDRSLTSTNDFQTGLSEYVPTNFMKKKKSAHNYYENEQEKVIELPYEDGNVSMLVILPKKKLGLRTLEKNLNYKTYKRWLKSLEQRDVVLTLPKFRLSKAYRMKRHLRKLDLKEPFTDQANFSGMTPQSIKISDVLHKTFIEVNEKGTRATVATGLIGTVKGVTKPIVQFHANHPFLYIIKDNRNDVILFMGRVNKPEYVDAPLSDYDKSPRGGYDGIKQPKYDKYHIVKKGETLFRLAKKYQTSVLKIQKMNNLTHSVLEKGQKLLVLKGKNQKSPPEQIEQITEKSEKEDNDTPPQQNVKGLTHTVNKGETLYRIAKRYKISVDVIKALNKLEHNRLKVGQKLVIKRVIKGSSKGNSKTIRKFHIPEDNETIPCNCKKHVVRKGETLFRLAKQYDTTIVQIKYVNQLDSNQLEVGQKLVIEK